MPDKGAGGYVGSEESQGTRQVETAGDETANCEEQNYDTTRVASRSPAARHAGSEMPSQA